MDFRKYYGLVVVTLFASVLVACVSSGGYGSKEKSGYGYGAASGQKRPANQADAKETITVTIKNFVFEPAAVTLSVSDTLDFVNEDSAPHTSTSTSGVFDTGQIKTGESASVSISDAGTYEYLCSIHPSMKGVFVVQ